MRQLCLSLSSFCFLLKQIAVALWHPHPHLDSGILGASGLLKHLKIEIGALSIKCIPKGKTKSES